MKTFILLALSLAGLLVILFMTSPDRLPLVVLPLPFLLIFLIVTAILHVVLQRLGGNLTNRFIKAVVIALYVVGLLVLSSLRQLTVVDIVVASILLLSLLGYLGYVSSSVKR